MKRLFLIVVAVFVCSVSFGQMYYNKTQSDARYPQKVNGVLMIPGGVKIGNVVSGTNIFQIDSVNQYSTDQYRVYKGSSLMSPYLPLLFKVGGTASTTIGNSMLLLTNPSAITWPRFNANNTITPRTAAEMRADLNVPLLSDTVTGSTLVPLLADSNIVASPNGYTTPKALQVGLAAKANTATVTANNLRNKLQFVVAASGIPPINGDSVLTHSYLKNKQVEVYVNGTLLYENYTATNIEHGYRFNATTGTIVFNPVLATTNVVQVNIIPNTITAIGLQQNMFTYSEQLVNNSLPWAWANSPTITANQKADLDGNMTLEKIDNTTADSYMAYSNNSNYVDVEINTEYTFSFDCDPATATGLACRITNAGATTTYVSDVSFMSQVTSGVVSRVSFTLTTNGTDTKLRIYPYRTISANSTVYIGRMQLAKGTTAAYITTTTAAIP